MCQMLGLCAFVCQVSVEHLLCVRCWGCCSEQDTHGLRHPIVHRGADTQQQFDLMDISCTLNTCRGVRLLEDGIEDA